MLKIHSTLPEEYSESNQTAWLEQQKHNLSEQIKYTRNKKIQQFSSRRLSLTDLEYNLKPEPQEQARLNMFKLHLNLLARQSPCSNPESSLGSPSSWSSLEEDSENFKTNYARPRPTA